VTYKRGYILGTIPAIVESLSAFTFSSLLSLFPTHLKFFICQTTGKIQLLTSRKVVIHSKGYPVVSTVVGNLLLSDLRLPTERQQDTPALLIYAPEA
jgi:hypothetical protein